jgi:CHAT domain-containing protein
MTLNQDERRQRADEAWANLNSVIDDINSLPGYELLLTPPSFVDVSEAVEADNPLVYLITTSAGSVALIIYRAEGKTGVEPVWADMTDFELDRLLIRRAFAKGNVGPVMGGLLPAQEKGPGQMKEELMAILPLLGERLLAPLAARLRAMGVGSVTLVPGGQLSLLPFHAAGYTVDGQELVFLDEFQVTYAPSALAAAYARQKVAGFNLVSAPALVVGNSLPITQDPLPFAAAEAEMVASLIAREVTSLLDMEATAPAVWEAMHANQLIHFAGHARFTPRFPQLSGMAMADRKMITLEDIRAMQLANARLVVLSACHTGLNDFHELPDEAIGLPAGFLEAGAAGIVTTLCPVSDTATALLMLAFYRRVISGAPPAEALCQAQRWLRAAPRQEISDVLESYIVTGAEWADMLQALLPHGEPGDLIYEDPYYWAAFTFTGA